MPIFSKKCVICDKKVIKPIKKHDQYFCSERCVLAFEKKLKELEGMNLDNCC